MGGYAEVSALSSSQVVQYNARTQSCFTILLQLEAHYCAFAGTDAILHLVNSYQLVQTNVEPRCKS